MKRWTITVHAETQAKAEEAVQEASVYIGDELFAEPEPPEYVEIQRDGHYRIRIEPPQEGGRGSDFWRGFWEDWLRQAAEGLGVSPKELKEGLSGQRPH